MYAIARQKFQGKLDPKIDERSRVLWHFTIAIYFLHDAHEKEVSCTQCTHIPNAKSILRMKAEVSNDHFEENGSNQGCQNVTFYS